MNILYSKQIKKKMQILILAALTNPFKKIQILVRANIFIYFSSISKQAKRDLFLFVRISFSRLNHKQKYSYPEFIFFICF